MRARLWKCAREQIREATNHESLGAELLTHDHVRQLLTDARSPQTLIEAVDVSAEWIREEDQDRERHSGVTSMESNVAQTICRHASILADGFPCLGVKSENEVVCKRPPCQQISESKEVPGRCQQLCAHVGSVGFVCLWHLSCVPSCRGFSHTVSFCQVFMCTRVCLPQGPLS